MENTPPLIQTKLHRLPMPVDLVPRPRLTEWLNERRGRPLTLVSAPAGYGKSTLISCWLESVDCPTAWISLDEHDNDLWIFLSYFLAAIQTIFPDFGDEIQALLGATQLPPISAISNLLINELNQIEKHVILVFDDYHLIENQAIHNLLQELMIYPARSIHMVLGTRMDPPLPLATLRADNQVTEIRAQDLRFNQEETLQLFQKMLDLSIDWSTISELEEQSEGWVTGLRLAALAIRHRIGDDSFQGAISGHNRYVTEYLISEILTKQAATLSNCMLKTSILDRFCADLCEAVCSKAEKLSGDGSGGPEFNGAQFLEWLQASNLFVIPLDNSNKWFRYHHLFREFLQQELIRRLTPDAIEKLHVTAGRWYAHNGFIEEALQHLLLGGDTGAAIRLIAEQRYKMMNTTQWPRLERWLNLFTKDVVDTSGELWMVKTWLVYHHGQYAEIPALLTHLDEIMAGEADKGTVNHLAGEIAALHCAVAYYVGDAGRSISFARKSLDLLDHELWIVRVMVRMYLGGSLLLQGDEKGAYQAYYSAFEEEKVQDKRFKATLLMTVCYFHWIIADLRNMKRAAKQSIMLCQESGHRQILGQANYHLGCVSYQQNDLSAAEEHFASVVDRPYNNYGVPYTNSVCGLTMVHQAMGKEAAAQEVIEGAIAFLLDTGNTTQLPIILALQAEVALMQGALSTASLWAEKLDPVPPLVPMPWFSAPHLTLVKVWLAQNSPTSLENAAELLRQLQEYLHGTHNKRFLIDTFALQALLAEATGEHPSAIEWLEIALRLAQPGEFIRLFVDLGPKMAGLLSRLKPSQELRTYVDQIRDAFAASQGCVLFTSQEELLDPLTNRELQILDLLGDRLTNKEIASQLVISPGTVKGHTIKIYHKLHVKGRRKAVEKAIKLGILTSK